MGGGLEAGASMLGPQGEGKVGAAISIGVAERASLPVLRCQCHRDLPWAQASAILRPGGARS